MDHTAIGEENPAAKETGQEMRPEKKRRHFRWIGWAFFFLLIILIIVMMVSIRKYTGVTTVSSRSADGAGDATYLMLGGDILKVSKDGAILSSLSGEVLWNEGFEMADPVAKRAGNEVLVYDHGGTEIRIFGAAGTAGTEKTGNPITCADLAADGSVAVLMQAGTDAGIVLYGSDGTETASGEIHLENGSFPVSLAVSPDGSRLCVALVNISTEKTGSTVRFYDFGAAGQKQKNNITAEFTYKDTVIPEVFFFDNGRAGAFGTDRAVVYSAGSTPKEETVEKVSGQIRSVFHNGRFFGYIGEQEGEDGGLTDTIEMYTSGGFHCYGVQAGVTARTATLGTDNRLILSDGKNVVIYNTFGTRRFEYTFDNTVRELIPTGRSKEYLAAGQDSLDLIRLN